MEIEREMGIQIAVSAGAVGVFIAAILIVGIRYNDNGFSDQGALALVALIAAFIVLMTGIGYWLSGREA